VNFCRSFAGLRGVEIPTIAHKALTVLEACGPKIVIGRDSRRIGAFPPDRDF